jgi:hypothetical protein
LIVRNVAATRNVTGPELFRRPDIENEFVTPKAL